jgi:hypothetical protein
MTIDKGKKARVLLITAVAMLDLVALARALPEERLRDQRGSDCSVRGEEAFHQMEAEFVDHKVRMLPSSGRHIPGRELSTESREDAKQGNLRMKASMRSAMEGPT